eukprot:5612225-Pyramimonas_sp.AAC.1
MSFSIQRGSPPRDIAPEDQQRPLQQLRFKATARPRREILHASAARHQAGLTGQAGRHRWMDHPEGPHHRGAARSFRR